MRAVVVYESIYGNTHLVADAIARGLGDDAVVVPVAEATAELIGSADLLVVGGPTHVHGMSRASTRRAGIEAAAKDETLDLDADAEGPGLRDWFDAMDDHRGHAAAAFDTRMHGPVAMTGHASKGIASRLRHRGFELVGEPTSFLVSKDNHLDPDEAVSAHAWGASLASVWSRAHTSTAGPRS
ncbi:MAG TPA: flavodoxin domain-containing protein [Acidimicrobiales bacterium]|nr:flavodoxin domain-containing protein [Acidimicrobiales bacterium]